MTSCAGKGAGLFGEMPNGLSFCDRDFFMAMIITAKVAATIMKQQTSLIGFLPLMPASVLYDKQNNENN